MPVGGASRQGFNSSRCGSRRSWGSRPFRGQSPPRKIVRQSAVPVGKDLTAVAAAVAGPGAVALSGGSRRHRNSVPVGGFGCARGVCVGSP